MTASLISSCIIGDAVSIKNKWL